MKKEYGRSMIEMLGVLAIIGVLSIGGLAGYTMAMNRHRANSVLDYVTKVGTVALTYGTDGTGVPAANNATCADLMEGEANDQLSTCTVAGTVVTIAYKSTSVQDIIKDRIDTTTNKIGGIAVNETATTFTF